MQNPSIIKQINFSYKAADNREDNRVIIQINVDSVKFNNSINIVV